MSEANAQQDLKVVFEEIDTDHDGFISRADLEATPYVDSLFERNENALIAFSRLENRMSLKDFTLLANAYRIKLHDFAVMKFDIAKTLSKYFSVSAPGEAGPSLKQSYLRLTAMSDKLAGQKLHTLAFEFGVDKPQQEKKIEELTQVLGHPPHQVFFLLRFKANSNGQDIAKQLDSLVNELLGMAKEIAPELQAIVSMFRVYARYGQDGFIYLVAEIDNPFVDNVISFLNEVVQSISPECRLKFKASLSSNVKDILKESFSYENSGGEVLVEFDIDNVTLKKIKEIMGDNVEQNGIATPVPQIAALLFEELKLSLEFSNLAEALQSTFQIASLPTPHSQLAPVRELALKETLSQFSEGFGALLELVRSSCAAQGQVSLNFHDFFVRLGFDMEIEEAFDLL